MFSRNMIYGPLFDGHVDTAQARQFRDDFIKQVATLAVPYVNGYFMNAPPQYPHGRIKPQCNPRHSSSSPRRFRMG